MAFTKTPELSTYETKRYPFVAPLEMRDTEITQGATYSTEARLYNVMPDYFEGGEGEPFLKTRPSLTNNGSTITLSGNLEERAYFHSPTGGDDYYVYGTKVYKGTTEIHTLTTSTGRVGFCEFIQSSGNRGVVMLDGTKGYVIDGAGPTVTEITDAQFPTPHIPMPVFLDGYIFVAKAGTSGTNEIYNSDLDAPLNWTAGSFISAENNPDNIVALTKINDYILAIGQTSVEFFYDAANATASPLAVHQSAGFEFGTKLMNSVCTYESECYMISNTDTGEYVIRQIKGFAEETIKCPVINEIVGLDVSSDTTLFVGRVAGQKLMFVNLITHPFALVYSFDTKKWVMWGVTSAFNGSRVLKWPRWWDGSTNGTLRCLFPAINDSGTYKGALATAGFNGYATDTLIATSNIEVDIYTKKLDHGSLNLKFMHRLSVIGEAMSGTTDPDNLTVSWSDNGTTFSSTYTLTLNSDSTYQYALPGIYQLGMFRRRYFRFQYSGNSRLRLYAFEVDVNKGQI